MSEDKPKALIFDVFGTCVDWLSGVGEAIESAKAHGLKSDLQPPNMALEWRALYEPAMQRIRCGERPYTRLETLHRENLHQLAEDHSISLPAERHLTDLVDAWERLPAWDDVPNALAELKMEFIIAPCSNGSIAMMTRLARYVALPWDCILGAEIANAYKPDPRAYLKSCEALRLEPSDVMMVAAHNDDLKAAQNLGLQTAFVLRPTEYGPDQQTDLEPAGDWNIIANDFNDLAAQLTK